MRPDFNISRQHGAVLVISLLLLLVMTVLALGASQATRMQERMAGNARDHDMALQSAESGLRAAERWISGLTLAPTPCATPPCQVYELGRPDSLAATPLAYRDKDWWDNNARKYESSSTSTIPGLAYDPFFVVEEFEDVPDALSVPPTGPPPSRIFYRVTSSAVGGSITAQTVLQSTYARRF